MAGRLHELHLQFTATASRGHLRQSRSLVLQKHAREPVVIDRDGSCDIVHLHRVWEQREGPVELVQVRRHVF